MSNRLAKEGSPYLLQHADNPVDWYPWGEEALERARAEDRPIFLSIGYSACHWCHVMAHESFEDEQTAAIMNEHFINVKVDREERPDLDRIYMNAVVAMTGNGGWPMSVFLTPEGMPFYGGTYFPPAPRYGMPSFSQVLVAVAEAWKNRRDELVASGQQLLSAIERQSAVEGGPLGRTLEHDTLDDAVSKLKQSFDQAHGGWGSAPKFPQPMALEFLLRHHHATGDQDALRMVTQTLEAMARGGMYDQLGGGFHRYSVDDHWLVPHFEKMLYDNSQLARVYLHAWQVTGNEFFRTITAEILDYVVREMIDPAGGFYSTQDADSEGKEGKFFVWTPDEIREVLGEEADALMGAYGVTFAGNCEGKNIWEFVGDMGQRPVLADARCKLLKAREQRVHPGRDDKVLTSSTTLLVVHSIPTNPYKVSPLLFIELRPVSPIVTSIGRSRSLITTSRLRRRAGVGRDGDAIRNATQIVARDKVHVPPDVSAFVERLDTVNPALFALLEKVNIGTARAFKEDRIGFFVDDLPYRWGQILDHTLIDAEKPGEGEDHGQGPQCIGNGPGAVDAIKLLQPPPLLGPRLEKEYKEKQADVDQVPADERQTVGREPVEGSTVEDGGQGIETDDQGQGRNGGDPQS
ncbi:MAG: thioredoxin domain-containing protein [Anaerolineae bacterium]|nr:MAG: thioredoxin domain-containing protein [Anaerolineae bacterium]